MDAWITLWTSLLWVSAAAFLLVTIFIVATSAKTLLGLSSKQGDKAE